MVWKMLWFDVEKRYLTTRHGLRRKSALLWFDVEKRYLTTLQPSSLSVLRLWFDVEKRYLTTKNEGNEKKDGCGLM